MTALAWLLAGAVAACVDRPPEGPQLLLGELLVEGQYRANSLELHEGRLYWETEPWGVHGWVRSTPLTGGEVIDLASVDWVMDLVVANESLYTCSRDGVHRVGLQGGDVERVGPSIDCTAIAVDTGSVFWIDFDAGRIGRTVLESGEALVLAEAQSRPWSIAIDGESVFWVNSHSDPDVGGLFRMGEDGEAVQVFSTAAVLDSPVSGAGAPAGLVLDEEYAYLAVRSSDLRMAAIVKVPRDGGAAVVLAHDSASWHVWNLALDETHVYWTRSEDNNFVPNDGPNHGDGRSDVPGAVLRAPKEGGEAELLAEQQNGPQGVLVDGDYVYWVNWASGNIRRIRKPGP